MSGNRHKIRPSRFAAPWTRWYRPGAVVCGLVALALLASVAIDLILHFAFGARSSLAFTFRFLLFPSAPATMAHGDSWLIMQAALEFVKAAPGEPLYEGIFFGQRMKFQYPPTALLPLHALYTIDPQLTPTVALNFMSWAVVIATMVAVSTIFFLCLRRHASVAAPTHYHHMILLAVLVICHVVTFYPLSRSFQLGQIQTWITFFFCLIVLFWLAGRTLPAGVLCAAACLIKPQLGLLVLWAALRRQWRFVLGWASLFLPVVLVSLWLYGLENHLDYLRVLAYIGSHGESYYANQSVNGLLHRLLFNGDNRMFRPDGFAPYNVWVHVGTLVTSLAIIGAALFWRQHEHERASVTDLLIAGLSFTIASPVAWEHHYGVMLPMFAVALPMTLAAPALGRAGLVWLAVSYILASNFYPLVNRLADTPLNFLQSYLFFGALLLLVHLYRLRHAQSAPVSQGATIRVAAPA